MGTKNETITTVSDLRSKAVKRHVELTGITPVLFDRYAGDNSTKLEWFQKVYQIPGSSVLCLPTKNLSSFFSAHNTNSAPKRLRDKRKYKDICNACLSFMMIEGPAPAPQYIPFLRAGEPITMGPIAPGMVADPVSGVRLEPDVARLDKGIPNPKERALLPLPWSLRFTVTVFANKEIKEQEILNLLEEGGVAIGIGTFRGVYGKFSVTKWAEE